MQTKSRLIMSNAIQTTIHPDVHENVAKWVKNHIKCGMTFRPGQLEEIEAVIENIAYGTDHHTHVISAPTGTGKSIMAIVSAGVLADSYKKSSYILCSDLFLWEQYADYIRKHKLSTFGMLKGQTGNYVCARNGEDMRNSECRMFNTSWVTLFDPGNSKAAGFPCASKCEYVQCRKKAISSPVVLATYQWYLYQINIVSGEADKQPSLGKRDVIFCDECHNIPSIVSAKMSPCIQPSDADHFTPLWQSAADRCSRGDQNTTVTDLAAMCTSAKAANALITKAIHKMSTAKSAEGKLKALQSYSEYTGAVTAYADMLSNEIASRMQEGSSKTYTEDLEAFKHISFIKNYNCHLNDFMNAVNATGVEYLETQVTGESAQMMVKYACVKEDMLVWKYLLSTARNRVLLSATPGLRSSFEQNIGVRYSGEETLWDTMPSPFDYSRSPVHVFYRYKMSFADKDSSLEALKPVIWDLIGKHKGQRGVVQTGNYSIAKSIMDSAPAYIRERLRPYNGSKEKAAAVEEHQESSDTVLIGPSLFEGVDLPGDQCRFIIILKMPYPQLKDPCVKAKMKLFPEWYSSEASTAVIQGIGRGVRFDGDWCVTYILDGCFMNLYNTTRSQYSKELQARMHFYK